MELHPYVVFEKSSFKPLVDEDIHIFPTLESVLRWIKSEEIIYLTKGWQRLMIALPRDYLVYLPEKDQLELYFSGEKYQITSRNMTPLEKVFKEGYFGLGNIPKVPITDRRKMLKKLSQVVKEYQENY